MSRFNAIPLYKLLSEAAKRHGDEVVCLLKNIHDDEVIMEVSQSAMLAASYVVTRPLDAAWHLENAALIALSLAKKLREK